VAKHPGIRVIPFDETRRLLADISPCPKAINRGTNSSFELMVRVPGKRLDLYPEDQQHMKHVQLEANLQRTVEDVAAEASEVLDFQPCSEHNQAKPVRSFSWASILDLLL